MENRHYSEREIEDLKEIQAKYKITPERFVQGLSFAESLADGQPANTAYQSAFMVDSRVAAHNSANLKRTKWIQELVMYLVPAPEVEYAGIKREIVAKNMKIVRGSFDPAEIASASNTLSKYILPPKQDKTLEEVTTSAAQMIVQQLSENVSKLAQAKKLISQSGEIIDVGVLE